MPKCILCQGSRNENSVYGGYRYKGADFFLKRCMNCGFMFLTPIPGANIIKDMYSDKDYFKNYWIRNSKKLGYIEGGDAAIKNASNAIKVIRLYKNKGSIIDIGCAGGHFLNEAKKLGFDCFGIELNEDMAGYARAHYGLQVTNESLQAIANKNKKFDIVYLGDTLEHIPDLEDMFTGLRSIMHKDSILVIECPLTYNRSLYNMFLALNMFFKSDKLSDNKPYHIWEFNNKTVLKLIEKYGFRIHYCRVFEDTPRYVRGLDNNGIKEKTGRFIKYLSKIISNSVLSRFLEMGDRVILVADKV